MKTDRELMQQALDALVYHTEQTRPIHQTTVAIADLHERLAQPELVAKPQAWYPGIDSAFGSGDVN